MAADSAALDIGVMMMDGYEFGPTANDMPYVLQGYEDDGVSVSDPEVNETEPDGVTLLMHTFQHRSEFKQIFEFVEGSEALGYFSWARMAQLSWSGTEDALENISTFYRTDGAALRVYLTTPMNETTTRIVHDPSVGVFEPRRWRDHRAAGRIYHRQVRDVSRDRACHRLGGRCGRWDVCGVHQGRR